MSDRDDMPKPDGAAMADQPAQYQSPPQSIAVARERMREIRDALTKDVQGSFPAKHADMDWDGMNLQPPEIAWQDMDMGQRYDLLLHVLDESIWSLEPSAKWNEPSDSQKLVNEFVKDEERQLHAEMRHDYGLRFLENRLVKYENTAERPLDHAAARGKDGGQVGQQDVPLDSGIAQGQATVTPPGRAAKPAVQPPHPWPSEIAKANRHQPEQVHDKSNGHDAGHSM
jgi:hypothetical protein